MGITDERKYGHGLPPLWPASLNDDESDDDNDDNEDNNPEADLNGVGEEIKQEERTTSTSHGNNEENEYKQRRRSSDRNSDDSNDDGEVLQASSHYTHLPEDDQPFHHQQQLLQRQQQQQQQLRSTVHHISLPPPRPPPSQLSLILRAIRLLLTPNVLINQPLRYRRILRFLFASLHYHCLRILEPLLHRWYPVISRILKIHSYTIFVLYLLQLTPYPSPAHAFSGHLLIRAPGPFPPPSTATSQAVPVPQSITPRIPLSPIPHSSDPSHGTLPPGHTFSQWSSALFDSLGRAAARTIACTFILMIYYDTLRKMSPSLF